MRNEKNRVGRGSGGISHVIHMHVAALTVPSHALAILPLTPGHRPITLAGER